MDRFVELAFIHEFFFYPRAHRCVPDPASEYHLIYLVTTSARRYDNFESLVKWYDSIFLDKIEFDYFNLNKIEE